MRPEVVNNGEGERLSVDGCKHSMREEVAGFWRRVQGRVDACVIKKCEPKAATAKSAAAGPSAERRERLFWRAALDRPCTHTPNARQIHTSRRPC